MTSLLYVSLGERPTSGATTTIIELLTRLPKFQVNVDLVELLFKDEESLVSKCPKIKESISNYKVIRLPYSKSFLGKVIRFILVNSILKLNISKISNNYDFVIGFNTKNSIYIYYLTPYITFPLYKHYIKLVKRTNLIEGTVWFIKSINTLNRNRKRAWNICAGVVLQEKLKEYGISCFALEPPAGVDLELIDSSPTLNGFDVIHVARQGFMKGTLDAVKVISELNLSHAFIGPVDQGFSMPQVNYLGEILDKRRLYGIMKGSRVFLYPSRVDSFGIVVAEALASGLPVVAYNIPAIKYYFGDCEAVKLVEVCDIQGLVKGVKEMINGDYKNVARECAKKYSWEEVTKSFTNILQKLKKEKT
ncbi:glycosyltransferase family 4 protein [Acidianus brierleyi]|uniref:Glycosyl transferase family 1 n=1 Tax=Acidianus brierleyi TaxID=41673 RepID=A0A2U9ID76_9CREN|nr:glycosyltransferase [Acidianus brierleyi]AWR93956.1 glycosyltransferase [Acidianus brierleyi]